MSINENSMHRLVTGLGRRRLVVVEFVIDDRVLVREWRTGEWFRVHPVMLIETCRCGLYDTDKLDNGHTAAECII